MNEKSFEVTRFHEQPKNNFEKLQSLIEEISDSINRELAAEHGIQNLLNPDCTISIDSFARSRGGIYEDAEIELDKESDYGSEVSNAVAYDEAYKSAQQIQKVEEYRQRKKKSPANKTEMAVTVLFHKMLKDEFISVRTSTHDDNNSGADNLMVNRLTGDIICAIDDVHEGEHDRGKAEKVIKIAKKGGVKIKYGITVVNKKIQQTSLENVPVFYLGLTTEQLNELLRNMSFGSEDEPSSTERKIFNILISSLEDQKNKLESLNLKGPVKDNLVRFESSLARVKEIAKLKNNEVGVELRKAA